jgi:hypothetical protein
MMQRLLLGLYLVILIVNYPRAVLARPAKVSVYQSPERLYHHLTPRYIKTRLGTPNYAATAGRIDDTHLLATQIFGKVMCHQLAVMQCTISCDSSQRSVNPQQQTYGKLPPPSVPPFVQPAASHPQTSTSHNGGHHQAALQHSTQQKDSQMCPEVDPKTRRVRIWLKR